MRAVRQPALVVDCSADAMVVIFCGCELTFIRHSRKKEGGEVCVILRIKIILLHHAVIILSSPKMATQNFHQDMQATLDFNVCSSERLPCLNGYV